MLSKGHWITLDRVAPPSGLAEWPEIKSIEPKGRVHTLRVTDSVDDVVRSLERYNPVVIDIVGPNLEDVYLKISREKGQVDSSDGPLIRKELREDRWNCFIPWTLFILVGAGVPICYSPVLSIPIWIPAVQWASVYVQMSAPGLFAFGQFPWGAFCTLIVLALVLLRGSSRLLAMKEVR